jgi:hypothetical protein
MAIIRFPVKKALVTAVVGGLATVGAAGVAGAASTTPTPAAAAKVAPKVNCAGVQSDLAAKVAKLSASDTRAANAGKAHRASVVHRNLAHWQKIRAHKINARFLRREAKLAALAAGQCQTAAPSTAAQSTVPTGTATT